MVEAEVIYKVETQSTGDVIQLKLKENYLYASYNKSTRILTG